MMLTNKNANFVTIFLLHNRHGHCSQAILGWYSNQKRFPHIQCSSLNSWYLWICLVLITPCLKLSQFSSFRRKSEPKNLNSFQEGRAWYYSPEDWVPVTSLFVQLDVVVSHHPKPAVLQHLFIEHHVTMLCAAFARFIAILWTFGLFPNENLCCHCGQITISKGYKRESLMTLCKDITIFPASSFCKR